MTNKKNKEIPVDPKAVDKAAEEALAATSKFIKSYKKSKIEAESEIIDEKTKLEIKSEKEKEKREILNEKRRNKSATKRAEKILKDNEEKHKKSIDALIEYERKEREKNRILREKELELRAEHLSLIKEKKESAEQAKITKAKLVEENKLQKEKEKKEKKESAEQAKITKAKLAEENKLQKEKEKKEQEEEEQRKIEEYKESHGINKIEKYEDAKKIRGASLRDVIGERMTQGQGFGGALKGGISDKFKAKITGIKEAFNPLNMASKLTGRSKLGTAVAGKFLGSSEEEMRYHSEKGKKHHTKDDISGHDFGLHPTASPLEEYRETSKATSSKIGASKNDKSVDGIYTTKLGITTQGVKKGDGIADILAKIYSLQAYGLQEDKREAEEEANKTNAQEETPHSKEAVKPTASKIDTKPKKESGGIFDTILKGIGDMLGGGAAGGLMKFVGKALGSGVGALMRFLPMLLNPYVLIAAVVGAIGYGIYKYFTDPTFKKSVDKVFKKLGNFAEEYVLEPLEKMFNFIGSAYTKFYGSILKGLSEWSVKLPDWLGGKEVKPFSFLTGAGDALLKKSDDLDKKNEKINSDRAEKNKKSSEGDEKENTSPSSSGSSSPSSSPASSTTTTPSSPVRESSLPTSSPASSSGSSSPTASPASSSGSSGTASNAKFYGKLQMPDEKIGDVLNKAADKVGVDRGIMYAIAKQESSFNPNAKAGTSSAAGLYQFIDSTWDSMVKKYGSKYPELKNGKTNPEASAIAGALFIKENADILTKNKIPVNGTSIYASHFLGPGGAVKLFSANPNEEASKVLGEKVASANKSIFYKDKGKGGPASISEVKQFLFNSVGKYADAYSSKVGGTNSTASSPSSSPTASSPSSSPSSIAPASSPPSSSPNKSSTSTVTPINSSPNSGAKLSNASTANSDMKRQASKPMPSGSAQSAPSAGKSGGGKGDKGESKPASQGSDGIRMDEPIFLRLQYGILKTV